MSKSSSMPGDAAQARGNRLLDRRPELAHGRLGLRGKLALAARERHRRLAGARLGRPERPVVGLEAGDHELG
jgi:hypothetical protein